jgi:hypothetical protein
MSDATHSSARNPKSSHEMRYSERDSTSGHSTSSYGKFFAMIGTSTAIMRKRCADHTLAAWFHGKRSSIWLCLWPLTMAVSVAVR